MPLALSTSCDTVPLGFTQVIAVDRGIPSFLAIPLLVSTATSRSNSSVELMFVPSVALLPDSSSLSMMPVSDTPNSLSSSVFFFQMLRRYLKSVNVDWNVPKIVAKPTLVASVFSVSPARATTSDRLQNWYGRRIISLQGLQPKSWSASRLPFLAACTCADLRLKIPRSPDLLSYSDTHSRMNVPISGLPL